jgi:hypothetical protein
LLDGQRDSGRVSLRNVDDNKREVDVFERDIRAGSAGGVGGRIQRGNHFVFFGNGKKSHICSSGATLAAPNCSIADY